MRQLGDNIETTLRQHWHNFEATLGQQSRVIKSRATMGLRVVAHVGRLPECLWQPHIISTPLKTTLIIIIIIIITITIIRPIIIRRLVITRLIINILNMTRRCWWPS